MMRSILVLLVTSVLGSPARAQHPNLTGYWVLKVDSLDAAADSIRADTASRVDSAAADSSSGRPRSDMRPVVRRRGKPEEYRQLTRLVAMAQPVAALQIAQSDTAVTLTNGDGFSYAVHPGLKKDSIQVGDEWVWVRARWNGRALEIEYRPPGGGRIIETYLLADSKLYLRLEVVVEHDLLAQRLWRPRMYRREEAPGS
jgi:hypothetical protein